MPKILETFLNNTVCNEFNAKLPIPHELSLNFGLFLCAQETIPLI